MNELTVRNRKKDLKDQYFDLMYYKNHSDITFNGILEDYFTNVNPNDDNSKLKIAALLTSYANNMIENPTEEPNLEATIGRNLDKINTWIDNYFYFLEKNPKNKTITPHEALELVLSDLELLIDAARDKNREIKKEIGELLTELEKRAAIVKDSDPEFKKLLVYLNSCWNNKKISNSSSFITGTELAVDNLVDVYNTIVGLSNEVEVINSFPASTILKIIDYYMRRKEILVLSDTLLYNYGLIQFYNPGSSEQFIDESLDKKIKSDVACLGISVEDMLYAIDNGPIKFDMEARVYIYNVFLEKFKREFLDHKYTRGTYLLKSEIEKGDILERTR